MKRTLLAAAMLAAGLAACSDDDANDLTGPDGARMYNQVQRLGNPLVNSGLYVTIAVLGSVSLSVVFTFLSAIAARAQQNAALMAILGFPIVTPVLMLLSRLAEKAVSSVYMEGWWGVALTLLLLDVLVVVLGVILFPFLWQE